MVLRQRGAALSAQAQVEELVTDSYDLAVHSAPSGLRPSTG